MSKFEIKEFESNNMILARAYLPSDYKVEAALSEGWKANVPFRIFLSASNPDQDILISSMSKETYDAYLNPIFKTMIPDKSGMRDFIEPEEYIQDYAQKVTGINLTPVGKTVLPSVFSNNLENEYNEMMHYFSIREAGATNISVKPVNAIVDPILMKFIGQYEGKDVIVLAGADYQGIEYSATDPFLGAMFGGLGNVFSGFGQGLKDSLSKAKENTKQMDLDTWLHGGLLNKKFRENKEEKAEETTVNLEEENKEVPMGFGHSNKQGQHVDTIKWGAKNLFCLFALKEKEEEATEVFLKYVASMIYNPDLINQMETMITQKVQAENAQAQAQSNIAYQKQMQNIQMAGQVSRNIAANNAKVSAGIMDSWDKKMASQTKMSQGFSEAIRGVNTYVNASGKTVEVGASADHVYQNKYGDTIGISGNDIDQSLASKLNWTKLEKK